MKLKNILIPFAGVLLLTACEKDHRNEMTELMEHIFSLSEVQRAVRHMAITHISQANREKELKADGTISSERHAD